MECHRVLDAAGGTEITITKKTVAFWLVLFVFFLPLAARGQESSSSLATIRNLFENKRWAQILSQVKAPSPDNADLDYYFGSAAAQLGEWEKARAAFVVGARLSPHDPRFLIEL